jgi:hypothetical protein
MFPLEKGEFKGVKTTDERGLIKLVFNSNVHQINPVLLLR